MPFVTWPLRRWLAAGVATAVALLACRGRTSRRGDAAAVNRRGTTPEDDISLRSAAAQVGTGRMARLLAAVAVLVGLFAMHGAAGPDLAGCHGPVGATAAAAAPMPAEPAAAHAQVGAHVHRPGAASALDPLLAPSHLRAPRAACLSTPPRRLLRALPSVTVALAATAGALPDPAPAAPRPDVPAAGVPERLLTRLCVCRT